MNKSLARCKHCGGADNIVLDKTDTSMEMYVCLDRLACDKNIIQQIPGGAPYYYKKMFFRVHPTGDVTILEKSTGEKLKTNKAFEKIYEEFQGLDFKTQKRYLYRKKHKGFKVSKS